MDFSALICFMQLGYSAVPQLYPPAASHCQERYWPPRPCVQADSGQSAFLILLRGWPSGLPSTVQNHPAQINFHTKFLNRTSKI